jgi:hypothetical protein
MSDMVIVPKGKYNSSILFAEPMICWFTTTEIAFQIWTKKDIDIAPSFQSLNNKNQIIRNINLPIVNV